MTLAPPFSFSFPSARTCLLVLAGLFAGRTGLLYAQAPVSFEATTEFREVLEGSRFELTFSLKNAQGSRFIAPELKGFKITAGPSEVRGMSILNGQTSAHQSWVYELEATRTGSFTIGSASVTVNGKRLNSKPLSINVVAARAGKGTASVPPGGDEQIFIVGELDRETVYPGQQVTWRIRLYTQLSVEGADIIELPDFSGFYSREKRRFDTRVEYQTVRGKKYAVKTLHEEALFPQEAKGITIGAAKVRAAIESNGGIGALLGSRPVLLQTQPVTLNVKPLPQPAPAAFTGAIGQYDWSVTADKTELNTDDALVVTVQLHGNGDANRVAPPLLVSSDSLEVFEPKVKSEETYEDMQQLVHSRVLEYIVLPKEPGKYAFQASFAFFDPDSNRFVIKTADKIEFQVSVGKNYQPRSKAKDPAVASPAAEELAPAPKKQWFQSPLAWGAAALFLGALLVLLLFRKKQAPPKKQGAVAQTQTPVAAVSYRERFAALPRLLQAGEPRTFYDALLKALQAYLSEKLLLAPAQMNQETVRRRLLHYQIPAIRIQAVLSVWQTCEQALYAGQTQTAQMENTWRTMESVLKELENDLKFSAMPVKN